MPKMYIVIEGEGKNTKRVTDTTFQVQTTARPDLIFEREGDALTHAARLAGEAVGREILVFETKCTISARKPTLITKIFNDKGELIPG